MRRDRKHAPTTPDSTQLVSPEQKPHHPNHSHEDQEHDEPPHEPQVFHAPMLVPSGSDPRQRSIWQCDEGGQGGMRRTALVPLGGWLHCPVRQRRINGR